MKKKLILIGAAVLLIFLFILYKQKLTKKRNQLRNRIMKLKREQSELIAKIKKDGLEKVYEIRRKEIGRELNKLSEELNKLNEQREVINSEFGKRIKDAKNAETGKEIFDSIIKNW